MNTSDKNISDYDAIIKTVQQYVEGSRVGKSEVMHASFHSDATLVGFFGDGLVFRPIQQLFDFIDGNGPAPDIEPRFASIEILQTIAVVHLEVKRWSGKVIGSEPRTMSDLFNLIKTEAGWKISQKMFHVYLD